MANVIDFPAREVAPDCFPEPGDRYQAYALWHRFQPFMLTLVFSTWHMAALRYDDMEQLDFQSLDEQGDYDGECMITLLFRGASGGIEVTVTGRTLYRLYADLGGHQVVWLWELPEGQAATGDGAPVVRSITVRDVIPRKAMAGSLD